MQSRVQRNVLLVFANPVNTGRLRLDTEAREIQQSIERSKYRDNINVVTRQATTIKDFRRALLEETFQVIHISGHGSRNGLLLANDRGGHYVVDPPTFAELFQRYPSIACVLLNACYSMAQGRLLASSIPFTIAMDTPLPMRLLSLFQVDFTMRWGQDTRLISRLKRVSLASSLKYLRTPSFQRLYGKERSFQQQATKKKAESHLIELILSKGSFLWHLPLICLALWIRVFTTERM